MKKRISNLMQTKISLPLVAIFCLLFTCLAVSISILVASISIKRAEQEYDKAYNELKSSYEQSFASLNEMYKALPSEQKNTELFKRLSYIDAYYRSLYAGEIDEERLTYYLMQGYIEGVGDKHGEYYTASDLDTLIRESEGKMYGIGVSVVYSKEYDAIEILTVTEGSPADNAGLGAGDIIICVEGERVSLENYFASINKVKGEKGTGVTLTVIKNGEEREVTCIRDEITITSVSYHKYALDSSIGIVRISEFNNETPNQMISALSSLVSDGVKSVILDVRNNPGGTLDSVTEILDYLLGEGDICHILDASGRTVQKLTSDKDCFDPSIKMAVLINENTASAAELLASCLRDYGRATLVGTKSYGKGSMQTTYMLPDGAGLKLTTNTYLPPSLESYDGIGITPNKVVELDEALRDKSFFKITDEEDNQLLASARELGYTK